jgi:predicted RNA binding protein YcfA (HicA-like mRNA interferase family)
MSKLVLIKAKELERLLFSLGFERQRQKGSHVFYRHSDGRTTSIPFHSGKNIERGLLCAILRQINVSIDEYNKLIV